MFVQAITLATRCCFHAACLSAHADHHEQALSLEECLEVYRDALCATQPARVYTWVAKRQDAQLQV
jgi:hypothetical protein